MSITAKTVASAVRLNDVQWAGERLLWHESRGSQGVLVAQAGIDAPHDLSGELSVKGRVGYGGGEFTTHEGVAYFIANGRLYRQSINAGIGSTAARPITPGFGSAAAPCVSPDGRWIAFVHSDEGADVLAVVDTDGNQWSRKLYQGVDFVMQPTWHPSSRRIAFITWTHPNMPWDGTELHLLMLDEELKVIEDQRIAGDANTAVFQPEFSPDGKTLSYISDASGYSPLHRYSQLYLYDLATQSYQQLTNVQAEHGAPAWIQGLRTYAWSGDGSKITYLRNQKGIISLWVYTLATGEHQPIEALNRRYTYFYQLSLSPINDTLAVIASSPTLPTQLISYHPTQSERTAVERIHRRTTSEIISDYTNAQPMEWTGHDGEPVYGIYYAPKDTQGVPPLIVYVHGGPTSQAQMRFEPELQFFATRGFAVLAVNHRGSTGYGREYAQKLYSNWGYYDVEDSASGATYLAQQGLADPAKFIIMGGSAGGFTVLQSLVDKPGFYRSGVCRYGISNHFMLETHKFEERYTFKLLGELPEAAALFRQRSPIFHVEKIMDPVILFQGEDDNVVPRSQSDTLVASLKARGIPHEYHVYPGEGHGFRNPATIEHYLNTTLRFLQQYVVFM